MSTRSASAPKRRARAEQGDGARLRDELVDAAIELLRTERSVDAVSLRAVARRVGVSAPSIYLHFEDRDALLRAVIVEADRRFASALTAAERRAGRDPRRRLRAIGRTYISFAHEAAGSYTVLFSGVVPAVMLDRPRSGALPSSFAVLFDACGAILSEHSDGPDASATMDLALTVWSWLHGYVTLRSVQPGFPWPDEREAVARIDELVARSWAHVS